MILHERFSVINLRTFLSMEHSTSLLLKMELNFHMDRLVKQCLHPGTGNHHRATFIKCLKVSCQNKNSYNVLKWRLKGNMRKKANLNKCFSNSKNQNRKK